MENIKYNSLFEKELFNKSIELITDTDANFNKNKLENVLAIHCHKESIRGSEIHRETVSCQDSKTGEVRTYEIIVYNYKIVSYECKETFVIEVHPVSLHENDGRFGSHSYSYIGEQTNAISEYFANLNELKIYQQLSSWPFSQTVATTE